MNEAHLHLLINHLPILGSFFVLPVLAVSLIRRKELAVLGLAAVFAVTSAAGAWASLETGEGAEEVVEELPGVRESAIHTHEERAELATILAAATALLAVGTFAWSVKKGETQIPGVGATLVAALATAGAMAATGAAGGVINHAEIRDGAVAPAAESEEEEAHERGEN